ncbi:hypothetical protein AB0G97_03755 [Streptomyces sp. NPDC020755]|uniref:hypothetical protein n=1 Tax=unclassified Streptomyces TaxID=2593676 RepID=UPI002241884C|nr:hypothetical protein [Streptomyces sp. VB1]UZI29996.1 hypothetical protein OH133_18735 [Streptomyces sp. VB1]
MATEYAPPDETTAKKSVTIPRSLAGDVEARTGARGFSHFVSDLAEHALALTKTREIVEAYEDEHGLFTPEEIEEARRTWHGE